MATYTISPRNESAFETFAVEAENYDDAARTAMRKLRHSPASHGLDVRRVTGERGKSGIFQTYARMSGEGNNWTSIGEPFHVC